MRLESMEGWALRDLVLLALGPHEGHDGIPGAPEGSYCARCRAEGALAELTSRHAPEPWPVLARLSCGHYLAVDAGREPGVEVFCPSCVSERAILEVRR